MGKVYALLVGINDYPPGERSLQGCVNDIENVRHYLTEGFADPAIEVLTNGDATYANVIRTFRAHLGRAGKDDVALFHYCGHGARSRAAAEFLQFDPDKRDEGLVCVDSRVGDNYDLADKELAIMIAEIAHNDPHIAIVLDCCHSGTGTRDIEGANKAGVRGTGEGNFPRKIGTYLDGQYAAQLKDGKLHVPQRRHILMAACDKDETAKEDIDSHRGVFTTALYDVLRQAGGDLTYAELFVRARARVREFIRAKGESPQRPQFETIAGFDGWGGFLGRVPRAGTKSFVAAASRAGQRPIMVARDGEKWVADAGAVAGIPAGPATPVTLSLALEETPQETVGLATVSRVGGSSADIVPQFAADPAKRYVATIASMPAEPLRLAFAGDAAARTQVSGLLESDRAMRARLTEEGGVDDGFVLSIIDGRATLSRRDDGVVAASLEWSGPVASSERLLDAIGHVAQWRQLLDFRNPTPQLDPAKVDFVFAATPADGPEALHPAPAVSLDVERRPDGTWAGVSGQFRLRNRTGSILNYALLRFGPDYSVGVLAADQIAASNAWMTMAIDKGDGTADPKVAFWLDDGRETVEQFKLVLGTEPIEAFLLAMDPLVRDRGFGSESQMIEATKAVDDDWFTIDLRVRLAPRLAEVGPAPASLANGQVMVAPHASVTANLALVTQLGPSRGTGADEDLAGALADAGLVPAGLAGGRGDAPTALEITGISDPAALAAEPLRVRLTLPVGEGEAIVPLMRDGPYLVPAGNFWRNEDGSTEVAISALPAPLVDHRSVSGSLRMWFFKTVVGFDRVNRLRPVTFDATGRAAYGDPAAAASAVRGASRVLLMIHGIIGDTRGMLEGMHETGLAAGFDCVLAYDYENLATPIDQTARQLGEDLAAAGLSAGDGKALTLVAHSMGGLVARWFVEKEDGAKVVDHLVMCGTPNAGSPFGEVGKARKVLEALLMLSANVALPFSAAAASVLAASAKLTPTLEQMAPDSEFVRALNGAHAAATRYTILAGDLAQYKAPDPAFFDGLLTRIGQSAPLDFLFGNAANDIAVKLDSILIESTAERAAARHTIGCHHLNYFSSPAGQAELRAVEWG